MKSRIGIALSALLLIASVAHAALEPKTTIKINFSSTAEFTESCGTTGTATASTLNATQKAAIIAKVQAKYDAVFPAGNVEVSEGSGGDIDIIVHGGKAPGSLEGKEYGDAGTEGGPCICHQGEFEDDFSGDALVNAIAETCAHEAGHKLGLDHNCDDRPTLMTKGGEVSVAERSTGTREFNDDDKEKLLKNKQNDSSEKKSSTSDTDVRGKPGETTTPPPNKPDDRHGDAKAELLFGPPGVEFGYLSSTGDFVFVGDQDNMPGGVPTFISIVYEAGIDLAVRHNDVIFSLSNGLGLPFVSNPNPFDPAYMLQVNAVFATQPNQTQIQLQFLNDDQRTGGFQPPGEIGTPYCGALPNSTGNPAFISGAGSTSVSANNLVLLAHNVPQQPGVGIFIAGPQQDQIPIFNGFLCINPNGLQRINHVTPPQNGLVEQAIDYTGQSTGTAPLNVAAGQHYNFQHWYRDPFAGGGNANFTDGYRIFFTP